MSLTSYRAAPPRVKLVASNFGPVALIVFALRTVVLRLAGCWCFVASARVKLVASNFGPVALIVFALRTVVLRLAGWWCFFPRCPRLFCYKKSAF